MYTWQRRGFKKTPKTSPMGPKSWPEWLLCIKAVALILELASEFPGGPIKMPSTKSHLLEFLIQ